ncbi:expressed unknown protein [Seminavis robusta]|uniref:Uncharacterized protein n=1 Tax=Seminavis robusta TaxID=568900 RepID=A0A9N8DP71_9STRA|nr:expressed unknown protein [Seminavis robusta]|eukprot:Sro271_g104700.1 n/a (404) ;mRNA; f:73152-74363
MDLLGNYSSSDDDDDAASDRSISPPTPIKKTNVHEGALPPAMPSPKKLTVQKNPAAAAGVANKTGKAKTNSRGKKLISLHSVLPTHILEQLTKSEATGDISDSSDEDDFNNKKEESTKKNTASKKKAASTDPGIANFLSALSSAKTMNTSTSLSKMNHSNKKKDSSKLGAAFLSVTSTTTITRTKKDGSTITKSDTTVPDEAPATPTGNDETTNGSPSHYKPLSLSPRTAFHRFPTSKVAAAPPVPMPAIGMYDNTHRHVVAPPPPATVPDYSIPTAATTNTGNSRSKKRQLQKALRAGQLDQALAQNNTAAVTNMDQVDPTAYIPQQETYAVPANGVRVAATTMYNPKAGTDVQANLGGVRARGKNQINQLMASAANFELQQARQGGKTNSQRAGAKRKYGW